ncbi:pitrilysin family protein [soil metagenome]
MKKLLTICLMLTAFISNAAEVVELKLAKSDLIVIKIMFKNGSICDPQGKDGLTNLTAELIGDGGTKDLTSTQIKDLIYPWAAEYFVTVDKEVSIFTFEVHKDHLDKFYPIIKGLILNPRFAEDDFNRIKSNQQNYVDQVIRSSSDEEYSKKALEELLFRGTTYSHMVAGTSSGVKSCTLDDVKGQYRKYFGSANMTIGIAGNYSPQFLSTLTADMNTLPSVNIPVPTAVAPRVPNGLEVEIIAKDNALGSAIFAGFPMDLNRSKDDFAAMMIANSWLGEHRKSYSRLYQKIREQRSMNYGDYSYIEWYGNGGSNMLPKAGTPRSINYTSLWLRPVQTAKGLKGQYPELESIEIGHAHFALRMALREMDLLVKNGLTQQDFDLTRNFLVSYIKLYAQTPEAQLGYLLDSKFYGRKDWLKEADALLQKTTLADVNAAMKKYWQTQNMYVTIVTDRSETVPLARSLRDNLPSPMSYSNVLKGVLTPAILEEDKLVENYPLKVTSVKIIDSNDTFR